MVENFANVIGEGEVGKISSLWSQHYDDLRGARGLFTVKDPLYAMPSLPGDRNFSDRCFLRNWMASKQLLLLQNRETAREFRYCAPIFCDTNFVSYCEAFHEGRDLGANEAAFRQSVSFLLPMADACNAFPYLMENADNPDRERVRRSLTAFAAFKLTSAEKFDRNLRFDCAGSSEDPSAIADGCLRVMDGDDFRLVHSWMKKHFVWSRIILIKAAIIVFEGRATSIEARFYALLKFLHESLARLPQFEVYVAHRFFVLSSNEPFFSPVQHNARDLDRTLNSMAWDLAHWRSLFETVTIFSSTGAMAPFPVPHFLSFDRRFVKLTETFQLSGVIYSGNGRRCEQVYSESLLSPVSRLLKGLCREFYVEDAILDRRQRALRGVAGDAQLYEIELALSSDLLKVMQLPRA